MIIEVNGRIYEIATTMKLDFNLLLEMAEATKDYGSEVLADHINKLGETPRNKQYHDRIRADIAKAVAIIESLKVQGGGK